MASIDSPSAPRDSEATTFLKLVCVVAVSALAAWLTAKKADLGYTPAIILGLAIAGVGGYGVTRLQAVPRDLWFCFALKILSVTAYKALNVVIVLWLVNDHGFTKEQSLGWVLVFGFVMSGATVLCGSLTDAIGVKKTLLMGVTICVLSRVGMVFAPNAGLALSLGLIPVAVGEALCTPVLVAALRRYTAPSQRTVAFSLFYAIMNLGFTVAYFVNDAMQKRFADGDALTFGIFSEGISAERSMILMSIGLEVLLLPFILLLRSRAEMTPEGLVVHDRPVEVARTGSFLANFWEQICHAARETGRTFASLFKQKGFYRLLIFLLFIGLLKIVFQIMDAVLPTFMENELGSEGKSRVGRINTINGILILVLAPAVAAITQKFSAYSMVIIGGFITGLSLLFLAIPTEAFAGMASGVFGQGVGSYLNITGAVHPWFIMLVLWQITFSIGEAIYSPRVFEYATAIAPAGQEGAYASLSYVPMFLAKMVNGAVFVTLLGRYCPEKGPRDSGTMWLIVGLLILVAPVGLLVMKQFIKVSENRA